MPKRDLIKNIPETTEYVCQECDTRFFYLKPAKLVCPTCGNQDADYLVPFKTIEDQEDTD